MSKVIIYSIIAITGILLNSCNSHIFVEPEPKIETNNFYLEGNGGSASFSIPIEGLKNVRFYCHLYPLANVSYFNKDGEWLDKPTLSNVAKVVYSAPIFCLNFYVEGDLIHVKALDNTTAKNLKVSAILDYEYTSQSIDFTITPGKALEIIDLSCDFADHTSSFYVERGLKNSFINNSDLSQSVLIYPYKEFQSKIKLQIDDYDFWARGVKGEITIPFYSNGKWDKSDTNKTEITLGTLTQFYSPAIDINEPCTIELPANSKTEMISVMTYATLEAPFTALLKQPESGLMFWVQGNYHISQPISCKIEEQ